MKRISLYAFLLLLTGFVSCKEDKKRSEAEKIIAEWIGKTIQFSEDIQCNILGKDTTTSLCSDLLLREYKNMKKCILPILAVAAIVVLAVFNMNINLQKSSMSDVALTNVEALADDENGGDKYKYVEPGAPGSGVMCICWKKGDLTCCG
jgi:hypothetical protein